MKLDIVMITNGSRRDLLLQSMESMIENASQWKECAFTLVVDDNPSSKDSDEPIVGPAIPERIIYQTSQRGASYCRNVGAGSVPKYRRGKYVLFLDDDVYLMKDWDSTLLGVADTLPDHHFDEFQKGFIASLYSHPFNHLDDMTHIDGIHFGCPQLISTVCMLMPWHVWDTIGPFDEPGGAAGSEDYALCMRAKKEGYGFAVTDPQLCIHTGLASSNGEKIVGYNELRRQNENLIRDYKIQNIRMAL